MLSMQPSDELIVATRLIAWLRAAPAISGESGRATLGGMESTASRIGEKRSGAGFAESAAAPEVVAVDHQGRSAESVAAASVRKIATIVGKRAA
jgi:hypothetical protein